VTALPTDGRRVDAALLAGWTLLVLGLFADVLFLGRTLFREDFSLYEYPQHLVTARALLAGRLPEWNDLLHLGLPHLANPTSAVFYPPTWLDLLDVVWALNARVALHVWLAGVGTWLLARRLGAARVGAAVAALAFALGGPLLGYADNPFYQASGAWTPLVLTAWLGVLRGDAPWRAAVATGLALAAQVLAGDPQAALASGLWGAVLTAAWLVAADGGPRVARVGRVAAGGLVAAGVGLGVAAIQWVPSALFLASSVRASGADPGEVLAVWALHPARLATLLVPHLFGAPLPVNSEWAHPWMSDGRFWFASLYLGALTLPLALVGAWRRGWRGVAVAGGLFLALAVGSHTPVLEALVRVLPPLGWFRFPEKYALQASLALALLAGGGLTELLDGARRARWLLLGPVVAGGAVAAQAGSFEPWVSAWSVVPNGAAALDAIRAGGLQAALVGLTAWALLRPAAAPRGATAGRLAQVATLTLPLLVAGDLLVANGPLLATADVVLLTRVPSLAQVLQTDAAGRPFRVFRDSALDRYPVHRDTQGAIVTMARNRATLGTSAAGQVGIEDLFGYTAALTSPRADLVDSLFRELDTWAARVDLRYLLVDATRPAARLEPWVRAGLLRELLVDPVTGVRVWRVEGPTSRLVCERAGTVVGGDESCRPGARSPGRVEAHVQLNAPATLVYGATLVPGWQATIDGREAPLIPVRAVLQGLEVPAGAHDVLLSYRTPGLVAGACVSGAVLAAVCAAWGAAAWRRRRAASPDGERSRPPVRPPPAGPAA